jgi:hypothetical protein
MAHKTVLAGTVAVLATLALAAPVLAKSPTDIRRDALEDRRADQRESIHDGRRDGGITIWEKWRLNREQRRLDRLEREALSDGRLSKGEYLDLRDARKRADRHIHDERSNGRVRGWWWRTFSR